MANGKIAIDPALLMSQSAEMLKLTEGYDHLFSSVSSSLTTMNSRWSANLSNNFGTKISSAANAFSTLRALLQSGAESAKISAETFQSVDTSLGQIMAAAAESGNKDFSKRLHDAWNQTVKDIKDGWKTNAEITDWATEHYDELPDWVKELIDKGAPEAKAVLFIIRDIFNGEVSADTMKTYLEAIGSSTFVTSWLYNSINGVISDPDNLGYQMRVLMEAYSNRASECLENGDISGYLKNTGMELLSGGGSIIHAVTDGASEGLADVIDNYAGKLSALFDFTERTIPGINGVVTIPQSAIDNSANAVSKFLRNMF